MLKRAQPNVTAPNRQGESRKDSDLLGGIVSAYGEIRLFPDGVNLFPCEAILADFPNLVRAIRALLAKGFRSENDGLNEAHMLQLIEILEQKIDLPPDKPKRSPAQKPPVLPPEPNVEEPTWRVPSENYLACRKRNAVELAQLQNSLDRFTRRGKVGRISVVEDDIARHRDRTVKELRAIKLREMSGEASDRWREQIRQHESWERRVKDISTRHEGLVQAAHMEDSAKEAEWLQSMKDFTKKVEVPMRIVANLRRECRSAYHQKSLALPHKTLSWRLLPITVTARQRVISMLHDYQRRNPEASIHKERVDFAYELLPDEVHIGGGAFDGYLAFVFHSGSRVLLENPIYGNAAYVFKKSWKSLSRCSKAELLENHRTDVVRVIHDANWRGNLRRLLRE